MNAVYSYIHCLENDMENLPWLFQWFFLVFPWPPFVCLPSLTALYGAASSASSSCSTLAPSGSLTLGSGHFIVNKNIQIIPISRVSGKLSLFRMWGRERSSKEVASMNCTEGDVVKWERDNWDTQICAPLQDRSLNCSEHSLQTFAVIIWFYFTAVNATFIKLFPASAIVCWLSLVYPLALNTHHLSIWQLSKCKNKFIINYMKIRRINQAACFISTKLEQSTVSISW